MNARKKILIWILIFGITILYLVYGNNTHFKRMGGEKSLEIAKWKFSITDGISNLKSIELKDTYIEENLVNGKIAPGASGKFEIVLDATGSDINSNYSIKFNEITEKPKNLKFIYNGKIESSLKNFEDILKGTIDVNNESIKIITIEWIWEKQTGTNEEEIKLNNIQDTLDGERLDKYNFEVLVEGSQV